MAVTIHNLEEYLKVTFVNMIASRLFLMQDRLAP